MVKGRIRRRIGVFRIEKKWDEEGGGLGFRAECCGNENGPATSACASCVGVGVGVGVGGGWEKEKRKKGNNNV